MGLASDKQTYYCLNRSSKRQTDPIIILMGLASDK